jgi:hypothetical protein
MLKNMIGGDDGLSCIEKVKATFIKNKEEISHIEYSSPTLIKSEFDKSKMNSYVTLEMVENINKILTKLISENNGLKEVLTMDKIKEILKKYITDESNPNIIELYNNIMKYVINKPNFINDYESKKISKEDFRKLYDVYYKIRETIIAHTFIPIGNSTLFFIKMINEYADSYDCYFLGDSVYKFKNMMEILRPDITFNSILFSGNMYNKTTGEIKLDFQEKMKTFITNYYDNNKLMMDKLFTALISKKRICIFDFVETGYSILTFIYFIKLLNTLVFKIENIDFVIKHYILFINFVHNNVYTKKTFKVISKILGEPNVIINYLLININLEDNLWKHMVNSDSTLLCARCVPYYPPSDWVRSYPVYEEDIKSGEDYKYIDNYLGCNLNKFYLYIYLITQFKNIDPNIQKLVFKKIKSEDSKYFIYGDYINYVKNFRENIDPSNTLKLLIDIKIIA